MCKQVPLGTCHEKELPNGVCDCKLIPSVLMPAVHTHTTNPVHIHMYTHIRWDARSSVTTKPTHIVEAHAAEVCVCVCVCVTLYSSSLCPSGQLPSLQSLLRIHSCHRVC